MSNTLTSDIQSTRVSEKPSKGLAAPYPRLTSVEKRSIFLVLIGTFLEYFDLVLYVHLAVVLNPLFFPATDPWMAGLLGVFTFSSAYLLRPLGAFVFGYIGDKIGRKASIVWTSGLMGLAALTIACLPPYASIGFAASILFILARSLQGFSSIGEIIGAQVFIVEVAGKSPSANFLSILPQFAINLGSVVALGMGMLCLHLDPAHGWRWPFFFGTVVAFVGGFIRLRAIESPVFLETQNKQKDPTIQETVTFFQLLPFRKRNYWYLFGIEASSPLTFYFVMRYCAGLLEKIGLTPTHIIAHNFGVILLYLAVLLFLGRLSLMYDPLKILKQRLLVGLCLIPLLLYSLHLFPNEGAIFGVQIILFSLLAGSITPAQFQVIQAFPVIGRCTNIGSAYAISHASMYVITSMLIFFLDQAFGLWGVAVLFMITAAIAVLCASQFTPEEKTPPLQFNHDGRRSPL